MKSDIRPDLSSDRSQSQTAPAGVLRQTGLAAFSILRQPPVLLAVVIGAVSQGTMVFLMAPTPLAMIGCGFSEALAGDVIRWHVVAMFAPSFFAEFIIKKYGAIPVVKCGLLLLAASAGIAASGLTSIHFYTCLIILYLPDHIGCRLEFWFHRGHDAACQRCLSRRQACRSGCKRYGHCAGIHCLCIRSRCNRNGARLDCSCACGPACSGMHHALATSSAISGSLRI